VQALVEFFEAADLFLHHAVLRGLFPVRAFHRAAEFGQFLAQRFQDGVELFGVEIGELLRPILENPPGQPLEVLGEALLGRLQLPNLLAEVLFAVGDARASGGAARLPGVARLRQSRASASFPVAACLPGGDGARPRQAISTASSRPATGR
jgi:hypothetical protein